MRCPKCHTETLKGAANCPGCNLRTPTGKYEKAKEKERAEKRGIGFNVFGFSFGSLKGMGDGALDRLKSGKSRTIIRAAVMVSAMMVTAFGCYLVVFSYWESKEVDPVLALKALDKLRGLPSNQEGLTVAQLMEQELAKARESGNLKSHQGWSTKRIKGSDSKIILVFSYQDTTDKDHRAEWLVDLSDNDFIPQTELAWAVYGKAK